MILNFVVPDFINNTFNFRCTGSTYFLHFFHFVSALAIITVNSIALYIFGKSPKMKTPQHLYKINLAAADLMLGIFAFIPSIYFATKRFTNAATIGEELNYLANNPDFLTSAPNVFERFVGAVSWLSFLASVFTLIAASFDRMFATVFPKRYVKHNNCYVTIVVCVVVWIAAACNLAAFFDSTCSIVTTPYFVVVDCDTARQLHPLMGKLIMLVVMVANCSIVLLVLYFHNRFVFLIYLFKTINFSRSMSWIIN